MGGGSLGSPKIDYVICARPLIVMIMILTGRTCCWLRRRRERGEGGSSSFFFCHTFVFLFIEICICGICFCICKLRLNDIERRKRSREASSHSSQCQASILPVLQTQETTKLQQRKTPIKLPTAQQQLI